VTVRLLAAADLHLGRLPSGLPAEVARKVAPAHALERLVRSAVTREVDAVLLAGDLVDRRNASHEAWGPLDAALHRLREAGVPAVAVAGNHDAEALPLIAAELGDGHLTLLGRGGRWERWTLRGTDGTPRLHVDGWSFPAEHHPLDPTEGWAPEGGDDAPHLGLLHCDLGAARSPYAPVSPARLRALGHDAWVLGHIHAPARHDSGARAPLLYPGSLQPLDPGETGIHGAWLVELEGGGRVRATRIPLAGSRYDTVEVALVEEDDPDAIQRRIRDALVDHVRAAVADQPGLSATSLRLRLTGRCAHLARLPALVREMQGFDPGAAHGVETFVRPEAEIRAGPARDLVSLAAGRGALGEVARLLRSLGDAAREAPEPELLERARGEIAAVDDQTHLQEAGLDPELSEARLRELLRTAAGRLLDVLASQRERT
jgi:predicted phosphodiesterase